MSYFDGLPKTVSCAIYIYTMHVTYMVGFEILKLLIRGVLKPDHKSLTGDRMSLALTANCNHCFF